MTKIPVLADLPEVRAASERLDEVILRKNEAEAKARHLDERVRNGPSAAERQEDVARVLANEPFQDFEAERKFALREFHALEDAEQDQRSRVETARREASRKICDELRPQYLKQM